MRRVPVAPSDARAGDAGAFCARAPSDSRCVSSIAVTQPHSLTAAPARRRAFRFPPQFGTFGLASPAHASLSRRRRFSPHAGAVPQTARTGSRPACRHRPAPRTMCSAEPRRTGESVFKRALQLILSIRGRKRFDVLHLASRTRQVCPGVYVVLIFAVRQRLASRLRYFGLTRRASGGLRHVPGDWRGAVGPASPRRRMPSPRRRNLTEERIHAGKSPPGPPWPRTSRTQGAARRTDRSRPARIHERGCRGPEDVLRSLHRRE